MVVRVMMSAYGIPFTFPVRSVTTTLEYAFMDVGGKKFLLPVRAEVISDAYSVATRNVEEFRNYRKFGTETNLSFDVPDGKP